MNVQYIPKILYNVEHGTAIKLVTFLYSESPLELRYVKLGFAYP